MRRCFVTVEGQGEVAAAGKLLGRLSADMGLPLVWPKTRRGLRLHQETGIRKAAEYVRTEPAIDAWLVLRDEDDACPKERGPEMAAWLRSAHLPFPSAVVLFHPEYEVLFLPCVEQMAGALLGQGVATRPGLIPGTQWRGAWESHRDIKGWLTEHYPPNRSYKPTTDQIELTQLVDFERLRASGLACFGTLERALRFLATAKGQAQVYP